MSSTVTRVTCPPQCPTQGHSGWAVVAVALIPHFSALFQGRGLGSLVDLPGQGAQRLWVLSLALQTKNTVPFLSTISRPVTCTSRASMVSVMFSNLACSPTQGVVWLLCYLSAPSLGSGEASAVECALSPRTPSGPVLLCRCRPAPPRPADALPGRRAMAEAAPQAKRPPCPQHLCGPLPQCPQPGESWAGI